MKIVATDTLTVVEGVKSFDIIASPNALIYDPETGAMDVDSFAVEVWHTDSDEEEKTHIMSLADHDLTLEATAGGVDPDTSQETKEAEISYEEHSGQVLTFGDLLAEFNTVLVANGKRAVTASMNVFNYLVEAYSAAIGEYEDGDSPLFSSSTYPEVYQYHGSDDTYAVAAVNAMTSWVMAMCLAEIVPTSGSETNVQTQLFAKAYELGGGRNIPLYGSFALRADPMVGRIVAGAVYALVRGKKTFDAISVFRQELGGSSINANTWGGLGYTRKKRTVVVNGNTVTYDDVVDGNGDRIGYIMTNLGYLVNTDLFLPSAPGPRASGSYASNKPLPSTQGQDPGLFNSEGNYKVDAAINTELVANYRMSKKLPRNTWNNVYDDAKKNWLINTAALTRCTKQYMFTGRIYVELVPDSDGEQYVFRKASSVTALYLEGPFSLLASKNIYPFISETTTAAIENAKTTIQKFIDEVCDIADNGRFPTYDPNYGRRRPCSPASGLAGGTYSSEIGHEQNEIYNISLTLMVAGNQQAYNNWGASDQQNHAGERPNSYPSGHSAQIWTLAMLLAQMDPDNIIAYMSGAYRYSVGRTVGRCHWNSDIIYGRLFATMVLPLINAMNGSGWQAAYETLKSKVLSAGVNYGETVTISVTIYNGTNAAKVLGGKVKFYVPNPDPAGNEYGWSGAYNGYEAWFSDAAITLAAGQSRTFSGVVLENIGGRSPIAYSDLHAASASKTANVELGDSSNAYGNIVPQNLDTSFVFSNGCNCKVNIGGTPANNVTTTVTIVNNSGSAKTFDGRVCFITYGTYDGYTGYFRIFGSCAAGSNLTIPAGGSRTYAIVFAKDDRQTPTVALGMPFAGPGMHGQYQSNNGYYINNACYTCNDFSSSDTFREGGSYTMTIPSNTHEWTS